MRNEPILAIIGASASASEDQGIYSSAGLMAEAVVAAATSLMGRPSTSAIFSPTKATLAGWLVLPRNGTGAK